MAELVDAADLKSVDSNSRAGSSPALAIDRKTSRWYNKKWKNILGLW